MIKGLASRYVAAVKGALGDLPVRRVEEIAQALNMAMNKSKQIFVFGNGGSAATASHFVCDIGKSASCGREKRFKVICLNESVAAMTAYANDCSYEDIFLEQLKNLYRTGDIVIAISTSGKSKNVLSAVRWANRHKAITIGLTGFDGGELAKICRLPLIAPGDDVQKVEDIHLIIVHILLQLLEKVR